METLTDRARRTALEMLDDLPRRRAHVAGVAAAAAAAAKGCGLSREDADALVASAWLHDIGYAAVIARTGFHPVDGAAHAQTAGFPATVVSLIAHHTGALFEAEERGLAAELAAFSQPEDSLLDLITYSDLTTSPAGEAVDAVDRIAEILSRYPEGHPVNRAVTRSAPHLLAAVERFEDRQHRHGAGGRA
ncbi:HD domain-containing protein [Sinomonas sp. JGH33]|uniref:HD domain-containing protein n=1 Tax=Sinomonas terricola TaxID=3110330 RepID=A0ABU5TD16_9MICC|nr:HD domain-containing protein [Sinomonas sp. JGH33]MEA5456966.1 HD domain-containing protein [Sinomonas sp. JGH33]